MAPDDRARLRALVRGGRGLSTSALATYLDRECAADPDLRAEAEALLAVDPTDLARFDALVAPPNLAEAQLRAGETLGPFHVLSCRGSGATGTVYHVSSADGDFALKVLHPWLAQGGTLRRFLDEARMQQRLDHPGIARVHRADSAVLRDVRRHFFVMEYVRGEPLHHWLIDHQATTRQAIDLLIDVCDAVMHAHQRQVIHCDLKPENILVSSLGRAKVVDFSISRALDAERRRTTLPSSQASVSGTLPYMSPEQLDGRHAEIDARSDVYALGVVAYQVLARRLPIDVGGLPPWAAARKLRDEDPPTLSKLDAAFAGDLEAIVAKAMEKDPDRRYAMVSDLANDLRRYQAHATVSARLPSRLERAHRFARRHKLLVGGVLVLVTTLAAGVASTSLQAARAREAADRASRALAFLRETLVGARDLRAGGVDRRLTDLLDEASTRLEPLMTSDPVLAAMLAQTIGDAYVHNGQIAKAQPLIDRALAVTSELGEREVLTRLDARRSQGEIAFRLGRIEDAERLFRETHAERIARVGPDESGALLLLGWRARALEELGRIDEAEWLQREQLDRLTRTGLDERRRFESIAALAKLLKLRGQGRDAEERYRDVLAWQRAHLGADVPDVHVTENNLATLLLELGRAAEARDLMLAALAGLEAHFPPDHPDVVAARTNLEAVRISLGETAIGPPAKTADGTHGQSHDAAQRAGEAGDTKLSMAQLSFETLEAYRAFEDGDYERSERVYARVQAGFEAQLGSANPRTDMIRVPHAAALYRVGRAAEARGLLETVLTNCAANDQLDSLTATTAMTSLGRILGDLADPHASEAWCREASRRVENARFDNPLLLLRSRTNLARAAEDNGFFDEARDVWALALREMRADAVAAASTHLQYGLFLARRGRLAEARAHLLDAAQVFESRADVPAFVARECYAAAADVCKRVGDVAGASAFGACALP